MANGFHVLVINPGSTSTKIGLFRDDQEVFTKNLSHSAEEIAKYARIGDQYEMRERIILDTMREQGFDPRQLSAVIGRGGLMKPIPGGCYAVCDSMKEDLRDGRFGEHASNLGALIASSIAKTAGCPAFIADPVVVDELSDVARVSGNPNLPRVSIFHALNQKSVGRHAAAKLGRKYEDVNIIVVHLGGGVSVGLHQKGRVVDVNNALDGDGPFSPERSGGVPAGQLVKMCFSGKYTEKEIKQQITGKGGFVAYLGTNDARHVEDAVVKGDPKATLVHAAMAYQVSKEVGALAAAARGKIDAIAITGGIAYDKILIPLIKDHVGWIAEILMFPGERELESLRESALRVLRGESKAMNYSDVKVGG